jgi:hypothetical protein
MKYGSIEWIAAYFPEYLVDGEPIFLKKGVWPITGKVSVKEAQPWRFAPNVADGVTPNMQGVTVTIAPGSKPPFVRYVSTPVPDATFRAYCDTLNYYRNGGKTMDGKPGLDPRLLDGGQAHFGKVYSCPQGQYIRGTPAQFLFNDGTVWTG